MTSRGTHGEHTRTFRGRPVAIPGRASALGITASATTQASRPLTVEISRSPGLGRGFLSAADVSRGRTFLGRGWGTVLEPPGDILVVTLDEDLADTGRRIGRLNPDPDRVLLLDRLGGGDAVARLASVVVEYHPRLVVVDALVNLPGLAGIADASASTGWTMLLPGVARVARDSGAGILLLHHSRKSDGGYRDSSAIGASVDALFEMRT